MECIESDIGCIRLDAHVHPPLPSAHSLQLWSSFRNYYTKFPLLVWAAIPCVFPFAWRIDDAEILSRVISARILDLRHLERELVAGEFGVEPELHQNLSRVRQTGTLLPELRCLGYVIW